MPGGVLILKDGYVVGAVGISGDTSGMQHIQFQVHRRYALIAESCFVCGWLADKDEYCAIKAIRTLGAKYGSEPMEANDAWKTSSLSGH